LDSWVLFHLLFSVVLVVLFSPGVTYCRTYTDRMYSLQ